MWLLRVRWSLAILIIVIVIIITIIIIIIIIIITYISFIKKKKQTGPDKEYKPPSKFCVVDKDTNKIFKIWSLLAGLQTLMFFHSEKLEILSL